MPTITPCLWFDHQAEEAMNHYLSVFPDSRVLTVSRYGDGASFPAATVMTATFELNGQPFMALNGGPEFPFTEAISLFVQCETQDEVDALWEQLSAGGAPGRCGWLKDKFGLSWQIVPTVLGKLLADPDPEKARRVMEAMLKMSKLENATLLQAYDHGSE